MGEWYRDPILLTECRFKTDRLVVDDWSRLLSGDTAEELRNTFVVSLLTEAVTRDLPPGWQGSYDTDRAASWFVEHQRESTVLLVVDRSDGIPVGLLILSESESSDGPPDVLLGYMIDESAWGRGLATEVVAGFAGWCRANGTMRSVRGGVSDGNGASARVLQKNGFVPHIKSADHPADEVEYTLTFAP
jgi:RimJ/RimL family protein N-acetyltransferase